MLQTLIKAVLGISLLANAVLLWAWLGSHDKAVVSQVQERQAVATALECSQGTEALAGAAKAHQAAAAPLVAAAASAARDLQRQAQRILATPPANSADACTSAQARVDEWWQEARAGR